MPLSIYPTVYISMERYRLSPDLRHSLIPPMTSHLRVASEPQDEILTGLGEMAFSQVDFKFLR